MTASTEQERAEFEALIASKWPSVIPLWQESKGNYFDDKVRKLWWLWQAARRAPSVPDQSIIEAVDGWFARNTGLGGCSDKDVAELAAIFAAAPQPPEAAHVQLPGPVAFALEWTFDGEERGIRLYDDERHCRFDAESDGGVCSPLYTEQQVRELLAAHGIKVAP